VGAVALAVIFGVRHLTAAALIFGSAAAGAILRRALARYTTNLFVQPLTASLVAGVVGALAVRYDLSSSLRLVAVCPCMVLLPGPHFLNGMLDLIRGRVTLGTADLCPAHRGRHLNGTAAWTRSFWHFLTSGPGWQNGACVE
jgi:uncharacterized membrane protein YjjP (DUF1212 family)